VCGAVLIGRPQKAQRISPVTMRPSPLRGGASPFEGLPAERKLEDALARLDAAEAELAAYRDANLLTVVGKETYVAGLATRAEKVEQARSEVAEAQRHDTGERIEADLIETWPTLSNPERRVILARAISEMVVLPAAGGGNHLPVSDRVRLVWR
jgi:hypothetical protein